MFSGIYINTNMDLNLKAAARLLGIRKAIDRVLLWMARWMHYTQYALAIDAAGYGGYGYEGRRALPPPPDPGLDIFGHPFGQYRDALGGSLLVVGPSHIVSHHPYKRLFDIAQTWIRIILNEYTSPAFIAGVFVCFTALFTLVLIAFILVIVQRRRARAQEGHADGEDTTTEEEEEVTYSETPLPIHALTKSRKPHHCGDGNDTFSPFFWRRQTPIRPIESATGPNSNSNLGGGDTTIYGESPLDFALGLGVGISPFRLPPAPVIVNRVFVGEYDGGDPFGGDEDAHEAVEEEEEEIVEVVVDNEPELEPVEPVEVVEEKPKGEPEEEKVKVETVPVIVCPDPEAHLIVKENEKSTTGHERIMMDVYFEVEIVEEREEEEEEVVEEVPVVSAPVPDFIKEEVDEVVVVVEEKVVVGEEVVVGEKAVVEEEVVVVEEEEVVVVETDVVVEEQVVIQEEAHVEEPVIVEEAQHNAGATPSTTEPTQVPASTVLPATPFADSPFSPPSPAAPTPPPHVESNVHLVSPIVNGNTHEFPSLMPAIYAPEPAEKAPGGGKDDSFELPYDEMRCFAPLVDEVLDLPEEEEIYEGGEGPAEDAPKVEAEADETFEIPLDQIAGYPALVDEVLEIPEEEDEEPVVIEGKEWQPNEEEMKIIHSLAPWRDQLVFEFHSKHSDGTMQEFMIFLRAKHMAMRKKEKDADAEIFHMFLPWMYEIVEEFDKEHPGGEEEDFKRYLREEVMVARGWVFVKLVEPFLEANEDATVDDVQAYIGECARRQLEEYRRVKDGDGADGSQDKADTAPDTEEHGDGETGPQTRLEEIKVPTIQVTEDAGQDHNSTATSGPLSDISNVLQEVPNSHPPHALLHPPKVKLSKRREKRAGAMGSCTLVAADNEAPPVIGNGQSQEVMQDTSQAIAATEATIGAPILTDDERRLLYFHPRYQHLYRDFAQDHPTASSVDFTPYLQSKVAELKKKQEEEDQRIVEMLAPQKDELIRRFVEEQPDGGEVEFMAFLREYVAVMRRAAFVEMVTPFLEAHPDATPEEYAAFIDYQAEREREENERLKNGRIVRLYDRFVEEHPDAGDDEFLDYIDAHPEFT